MNEDTCLTIFGSVVVIAGVFLICFCVHETFSTERTALEKGYQETQNIGSSGTRYTKD